MTSEFLRPPVDSLSVPELIAITRSEAQLMLDSQRHATERAIFLGECLRAIAARDLYRLAGARTEQDFLDSLKLAKDEATGFVEASAVPMQLVAGRRIAMDKLRILGKAADWLRRSLCPEVGPHTNAEVLRQAVAAGDEAHRRGASREAACELALQRLRDPQTGRTPASKKTAGQHGRIAKDALARAYDNLIKVGKSRRASEARSGLWFGQVQVEFARVGEAMKALGMPVQVRLGAADEKAPSIAPNPAPDKDLGANDREKVAAPEPREGLPENGAGDAPDEDCPDDDLPDDGRHDDDGSGGAADGRDPSIAQNPAPDKDFGAPEAKNSAPPSPVDPLDEEAAALLSRWPVVSGVDRPDLYRGPFDGGVGVVPALTAVPPVRDPAGEPVSYPRLGAAFAAGLDDEQQRELNGALRELIARPEDDLARQRMTLRLTRLAEAAAAATPEVPLGALLTWVALCSSADLNVRVPAALHSLLCFRLGAYRQSLHDLPLGAPPERFRRLIVLAISRVPLEECSEWFLAAPDDFQSYLAEHLRLLKTGADYVAAMAQATATVREVRAARVSGGAAS